MLPKEHTQCSKKKGTQDRRDTTPESSLQHLVLVLKRTEWTTRTSARTLHRPLFGSEVLHVSHNKINPNWCPTHVLPQVGARSKYYNYIPPWYFFCHHPTSKCRDVSVQTFTQPQKFPTFRNLWESDRQFSGLIFWWNEWIVCSDGVSLILGTCNSKKRKTICTPGTTFRRGGAACGIGSYTCLLETWYFRAEIMPE